MSGFEFFGYIVAMYVWLMANPLVSIVLYILPIIIAAIRKHKSTGVIAIIGLLFGWIFLLWIILMIWAAFGEASKTDGEPETPPLSEEEAKKSKDRADAAAKAKARAMDMFNG